MIHMRIERRMYWQDYFICIELFHFMFTALLMKRLPLQKAFAAVNLDTGKCWICFKNYI